MDVVTAPCLSGADQAEGVVIVVDVFRAGNTAAEKQHGHLILKPVMMKPGDDDVPVNG